MDGVRPSLVTFFRLFLIRYPRHSVFFGFFSRFFFYAEVAILVFWCFGVFGAFWIFLSIAADFYSNCDTRVDATPSFRSSTSTGRSRAAAWPASRAASRNGTFSTPRGTSSSAPSPSRFAEEGELFPWHSGRIASLCFTVAIAKSNPAQSHQT